jgi:aminopeptidase
MRDFHLDKLAKVLVHYSNEIKEGQIVAIHGDPLTMPLVEAIYEEVLKAKAHPFFFAATQSLQEIFLQKASSEQLSYPSPFALHQIETIDATFRILGETNSKAFTSIDPKRQSLVSQASKGMKKIFQQRAANQDLAWVLTQYPTQASAQDAGMTLDQYESFVFNAGLLNEKDPVSKWKEAQVKQQRVIDYVTGKKELHFKTDAGTDLLVNIEGMAWLNSCGTRNFPDGEVFTGPNLKAPDGGMNGRAVVSFPACHHGREVNGVVLTFEKGRVVEAKADSNLDFLKAMLSQDPGASIVGEIALGTNYNIKNYTKNTLFDEKIGGTFHFAVGSGYPQTGNCNESGLHWDMICDLHSGGEVYCDGELISKNGVFAFEGWPGR